MIKKLLLVSGILGCVLLVQGFTSAQAEPTEEQLWDALRSKNHFAMIRHALAPGTGDPSNFTLGRRETQRNLSGEGRNQAKHIGDLFRAHGIDKARVFSSAWYRCLDTAELLDLGPVNPLPALNSFFQDYGEKETRTGSLRLWLSRQEMDGPLALVTHQVNITALLGVYAASGEIVVVERGVQGELEVLGASKPFSRARTLCEMQAKEMLKMARYYADCREHPGIMNCLIAISADSKDELLEAAVQHAVSVHGHEDSPELREQIKTEIKEGSPAS